MIDSFTVDHLDALRNWVGTIGGVVALTIAARTYRRNVRVRSEEQARLVYSGLTHAVHHGVGAMLEMLPNDARVGGRGGGTTIVTPTSPDEKAYELALVPVIQVTAVIHNRSKELIGPAKIQLVNSGLDRIYDTFSVNLNAVEPETDYIVDFVFPNDVHPGSPSLATTLLFRDASGQWWRRHRADPIERVHDDPENNAWTPAERAGWDSNVRAMGREPSPEPELLWRVRWHRFLRGRRGQRPIP